jgi:hypothetical protein
MGRVLILLALAVLVWIPGAYGQCDCETNLKGAWGTCCDGTQKWIDVCAGYGSKGCKSIYNSIPCRDGCAALQTAGSCTCPATEGPAARRESPVRSVGSAGCQASLARLEQWVRAHPFSRHMQELRAENRQ